MEMFYLPITLGMVSCGPAILDTKGRAQFLHQGGCEVCPSITQQLGGCFKNCYEVLIEHLHDRLGSLVLCHHCKGILMKWSVITRTFLTMGGLFSSIVDSMLV